MIPIARQLIHDRAPFYLRIEEAVIFSQFNDPRMNECQCSLIDKKQLHSDAIPHIPEEHSPMIYCVELAFSEPAREVEWSAWYSRHLGILLSVPGFSTAQRFQSLAPCRAPYLAAYSVTSRDVFESAPYRLRGGRASPGEWAPLMIHWDRNLFDGLAQMPNVMPDEVLAVIDHTTHHIANLPLPLHTLICAGLDRTVASRGIAVLSAAAYATVAACASEHIRFYQPLTAQLHAVA